MASNSFVGVREPPQNTFSKRVETIEIDVDGVAVQREVVNIADSTDPDAKARVKTEAPAIDDPGLVVRVVPSAGNYDSDLLAIPAIETQVTDDETKVDAVILSNQTTRTQWVTLKNDLGVSYLNQYPLDPKQFAMLDFKGATFAGGIRWLAKEADAVHGQIVGNQ